MTRTQLQNHCDQHGQIVNNRQIQVRRKQAPIRISGSQIGGAGFELSCPERSASKLNRNPESVQAYNTAIRRLPGALWAGLFGFEKRAAFEAAPQAAEVPQVQF